MNLQTPNCGRTIFHEVMSHEVSDLDLIYKMVSLGALINLTDVHGTTPLMDLVKNSDAASKIYADLTLFGKRLLIDAQNCTGETVLWRSIFHGRLDITRRLLEDGTNPNNFARIQGSLADFFVGSFGFRPFGITVTNYRRRPLIKNLPPILSPLLFDSPCCLNERNKTGQKNGPLKLSMVDKFSVNVFNQVIKSFIAPLVDGYLSKMTSDSISDVLCDLLVIHTDYKHLVEEGLFPRHTLVPLILGNTTSGLRQHAIRKILQTSLFDKSVNALSKLMRDLEGKIQPITPIRIKSMTQTTSVLKERSLEAMASSKLSSSFSDNETGSHVRSSTPFPVRSDLEEERLNRYDENWYLGESPQFGQPIILNSMEMNTEIEISQNNGRQTVSRLQRMLKETDDRLEKLQSEVGEVATLQPPVAASKPLTSQSSMSNLSEEDSDGDLTTSTNSDSEDGRKGLWPLSKLEDEELSEPRKKPSSLFSLSPFGKFTPRVNLDDAPDPRFDEAVVRLLTPSAVEALRVKLGLPPGLRPLLELEVARLQLGASLFHHSTLNCDRGCEGVDEESDLSSSEDDLDSTTSWDDSLSEPSSNENQEDSSFSESDDTDDDDDALPPLHDPIIPERPRILSSSSSSSDSLTLPEVSGQMARLQVQPGGDRPYIEAVDSPSYIMQFMIKNVQDNFGHSTDSDSDSSTDELPELE